MKIGNPSISMHRWVVIIMDKKPWYGSCGMIRHLTKMFYKNTLDLTHFINVVYLTERKTWLMAIIYIPSWPFHFYPITQILECRNLTEIREKDNLSYNGTVCSRSLIVTTYIKWVLKFDLLHKRLKRKQYIYTIYIFFFAIF